VKKVSCVIPTRGDVDLTPVLESLPFDDVVVWNNAKRDDLGIYGRYAAIAEARHDVIVSQDDDVIVTCWPEILRSYEPGVLTVNYAEPWDIPWPSVGSIFDRDLPERAFALYESSFPRDRMFTHQTCDAVFALLTEQVKVIYHGHENLPHGFAEGRVSTTPGWYTGPRAEVMVRCRSLRAKAAA
jgi:hypothetical protein